MRNGPALRTVLGDIDPSTMGITLPHEHVFCDSQVWLQPPQDDLGRRMADAEPQLSNLWWLRQWPNSNREVLILNDPDVAAAELAEFRDHGGRTIVDVTPAALGRDVVGLANLAARLRINIVAGTGHYVAAAHEPWIHRASVDQIAERMISEINEGVGATKIRCGVIGEIGMSWPVHPDEKKVLTGAAVAQQDTGAAITVHTAAHAIEEDSALAACDILKAAGADLTRTVMGHMDTTLHRPDYHRNVLDRGCRIEYDLFGHEFFETENSFQPFGDTETARAVAARVDEGWAEQMLLSHDICYKIQLQRWGGYGYAHLLRNIRLRLQMLGVSPDTFHILTVSNPAAVFPLQPSAR